MEELRRVLEEVQGAYKSSLEELKNLVMNLSSVISAHAVELKLLDERYDRVQKDLTSMAAASDIRLVLEKIEALRSDFSLIQKAVFGLIALMAIAVVTALLATVIRTP